MQQNILNNNLSNFSHDILQTVPYGTLHVFLIYCMIKERSYTNYVRSGYIVRLAAPPAVVISNLVDHTSYLIGLRDEREKHTGLKHYTKKALRIKHNIA
jgi:hypothetical protein